MRVAKEWETWAYERYEPVAVGNDTVEVRYRIRSVGPRLVTFETHYRFVKGVYTVLLRRTHATFHGGRMTVCVPFFARCGFL